MSRRPWRFAPAEIKRAIALVKESGLSITKVEIGTDGRIIVGTDDPKDAVVGASNVNPWDEVLTNAANEKRPS